MKNIRLKKPEFLGQEFPDDIARMVRVLGSRGYFATPAQVEFIWSAHSKDWSAGWLFLPENDDDLFRHMEEWFEEIAEIAE